MTRNATTTPFDFLGFTVRHYRNPGRLLNPILWGWAAYYRTAVSKKVFADIDSTL